MKLSKKKKLRSPTVRDLTSLPTINGTLVITQINYFLSFTFFFFFNLFTLNCEMTSYGFIMMDDSMLALSSFWKGQKSLDL
jgi:hypothetical protein